MTLDIAKLKAAAEKATPGPWRLTVTRFNGITRGPFSLIKEDALANAAEKVDAEFIAAANPAAVLELIAALEAAEKHIAELEAAPVAPVAEGETAVMPDYPGTALTQRECYRAGWEDRNAMLNQPVSQPYKLPEVIHELVSAVRSINRAKHHIAKGVDDDEPCYWQRKEWIDWVLSLCDEVERIGNSPVAPDGWVAVPVKPTKEMLGQIHPITEADCPDCGKRVTADCEDNVLMSWDDMLAAAPAPGKEG